MSRQGLDLGRYHILEPIGSGGMAVVYRGQHVLLRHQVAVKVLHPHYLADHAMRRRFLREARMIASLRHPGIVEVFDVGTASDGRVYVAMELLRGQPLSARLRAGRLSERAAVRFGRQLASALAVAHARGVVHRDLKPDNIFLIPDDEAPGGERAKILDFGVAKRVTYVRSADQTGAEQTKTGVLLGTPMYMSPEQCTEASDIDGRADLYALGIVLYQMVAGAPPFAAGGTEEIIAQHMYVQAPPACDAVPGVSARFSAIIERLMAKDRDDRYDSAETLAAELAMLAGGEGEVETVGAAEEDEETEVELVDRDDHTQPWTPAATEPVERSGRGRWRAGVIALAGALVGALVVAVATRAGSPRNAAAAEEEVVLPAPPAAMAIEKPMVRRSVSPEVKEVVVKKVVARPRAEPKRVARKIKIEAPRPKEDPFAKVQTPAVF
ncbi:MAG TPA: serine/threonine-protein kinase [Kofleriaceae bacterium]|jgi:serine/threonine-protein kinase|nr:serine/threonine-protein kinase [Kofleriaceae bacterium]